MGRRNPKDPSAEILDLFGHLQNAQSDLDKAFGGLEAQFLTGSSELEHMKESGDQFARLVEKLVNLAAGKNGAVLGLAGCMQLIEEATHFLAGCEQQPAARESAAETTANLHPAYQPVAHGKAVVYRAG